jgi:hypothetical protein
MLKRYVCFIYVLLLAIGHTHGATPLARYRYTRAVDGSFSEQEFAAIELDQAIWGVIGTADIDVRIADHNQNAVPHLLRKAGTRETRMVRHRRNASIETLADRVDNQIELRVGLEKNAEGANVVDFDTPLKDFEKAVTVWGIQEDTSEILLAERARIFDYSRFADVRNTAVNLPEDSTRYRAFRILIEDVVDEEQLPLRWETRRYEGDEETLREEHRRIRTRPFRMNAVRLYERRTEDARSVPRITTQDFPATTLRREQDPAKTILEVEHTGAPLTAILIACDDNNFSRRAIVQIPIRRDGRETWRDIAAGQISRISFRNVQHEPLQVGFSETRSQRFRIILEDHDNPPLQNVTVKGKGPILQAVFLAEPDTGYTLYYGVDGSPRPPRYDLAPLERLLRREHEPVLLPLKAEIENPDFAKAGFLAGENTMRILFGVAIVVMLVVLATGLYRASRHIP